MDSTRGSTGIARSVAESLGWGDSGSRSDPDLTRCIYFAKSPAMKTMQRLLALALLSGSSVLLAPVSAPAVEAPRVVFEIATSDGTSIPVEWVRPGVRRRLTPGEDVALSWSADGTSAEWGGVPMSFSALENGAELVSFGKDLLSVRILEWSPERGGTLRVGYRRSLLAYVGRQFEDFAVVPAGAGYALVRGGREVRSLQVSLDFPLLRSPGVRSITPKF